MQEAFNAKAQRGEAATEAERDRSPVAAAPHEAGCQVKPDVPLRSGPLRAGGPPARRRFRRFFAACEQLRPLQCKDAKAQSCQSKIRMGLAARLRSPNGEAHE